MDQHYSYRTYETLSFALPIAILLFAPFVAVMVLLAIIFSVKVCLKKDIPTYMWTGAWKTLGLVYGDNIQFKDGKFTLYGRKLTKLSVVFLLWAVVITLACVIVSFESQFLLTQGNSCSPLMDCFVVNATASNPRLLRQSPIHQDPLSYENCTALQDENFQIVCYSFSFQYISATGNSGGIIIVAGLIMTIQAGVVAAISTLKEKLKRWKKYIVVSYLMVHIAAGMAIFLLVLALIAVPAVRNALFQSRNTVVQFAAYYTTFVYSYIAATFALFDFKEFFLGPKKSKKAIATAV